MVDWLRIWTPRIAHWDLPMDEVVKRFADGTEVTLAHCGKQVPSFDTSVRIRPVDAHIEVSGNPSKFLQGHNLFGSDDIPKTTVKFLRTIEEKMEMRLFPAHILPNATLHEIHLAQMVDMESPKNKTEFLRQLGHLAKTRHKAQSYFDGETVYFGKGMGKGSGESRLYFWRFYDKYLEAKKRKTSKAVLDNWDVTNHLRAEVVIKSMYLRQYDLHHVNKWKPETVPFLYKEMLNKIKLSTGNIMETITAPVGMDPRHKRSIWYPWVAGETLQASMTRPTFYRWKSLFLERYGIDISRPPYKTEDNLLSFGWAKLMAENEWMTSANRHRYRKVA